MTHKKKPAVRRAQYGYRRTWGIQWPPVVGTASPLYGLSKRLQKRGPVLQCFPVQKARVDAHYPELREAIRNWDDSPTSNWDLGQATILLSVSRDIGGPRVMRGHEYSAHSMALRGPATARLGLHYFLHALVTRSRRPGLHKHERAALAAALRDAADLLIPRTERQNQKRAPKKLRRQP